MVVSSSLKIGIKRKEIRKRRFPNFRKK